MNTHNIQEKEGIRSSNMFDLNKVERECQKLSPIYGEVLQIFRKAFSYVDISKIIKNL